MSQAGLEGVSAHLTNSGLGHVRDKLRAKLFRLGVRQEKVML